ncbi:MAG: 16S rRNA (guanine(966)-N(2))-methyltransferase RsmD [Planctomycetaceae bacterium]
MRIIRGRLGKRKLLSNPGQTTRPIADRVKESLFEFLDHEVPDARIIDIFAGTGTLGLEALSRGGHSVVFIERDRKAVELLKKNIANLKVERETLCWANDVERTSFRPKNCDDFLPYDICFFDPPYRMVQKMVDGSKLYKALQRLARDGVTREGALLLFRTPSGSDFHLPPEWKYEQTMDYSTMDIHWFHRLPVEPLQEDEAEPEPAPAGQSPHEAESASDDTD